MKSKTKVVKKVSVRQKRVTISDTIQDQWAKDCIVIMERSGVLVRTVYRRIAQHLDVDILTVKNAFLLNLATPNNIERITKFLERWKAEA